MLLTRARRIAHVTVEDRRPLRSDGRSLEGDADGLTRVLRIGVGVFCMRMIGADQVVRRARWLRDMLLRWFKIHWRGGVDRASNHRLAHVLGLLKGEKENEDKWGGGRPRGVSIVKWGNLLKKGGERNQRSVSFTPACRSGEHEGRFQMEEACRRIGTELGKRRWSEWKACEA